MIYNFKFPDTTVKTAGLVAAGASSILKGTNTLINYAYGISSKYLNEATCTLNKKGLDDLKKDLNIILLIS